MSIDKDKITELLRNYPSYKYAVRQYENHRPYPQAGIANYSGMPSGSGAPERFFVNPGKPADMGATSFADLLDYEAYRGIVNELEGALATLTEDEQSVVALKWVHDITLKQIAERKGMSIDTVKRLHKRGLAKLTIAMRFTKVPEIMHIEIARASTF
jgi:predicted DNA-binding protein (UPF0251 family)